MERLEKLTREDLRSMEMGETKTFHLMTAAALDSAAVTAGQVGRLDGCKYSCSRDYDEKTVTVTKSML